MLTETVRRAPLTMNGARSAVEDPLGDLDGGGAAVVFDDHDRELVAAEAGDQVVGPDAVVESGGQLDEKRVAAFVTERVVDVLEVVDVDEEHAFLAGSAVAARAERCGQSFGQRRPVRQSGERVVGRPNRQRPVTVVQGADHAVERFGQLAQLVAARDLDAMVVFAGLELQDALVHAGDRSHQVLVHPPTEVHGHGQRQPEQADEDSDEDPFEIGVACEPPVHHIERRTLEAVQQRDSRVARRPVGRDSRQGGRRAATAPGRPTGHRSIRPFCHDCCALTTVARRPSAVGKTVGGLVEPAGKSLLRGDEGRPVDRLAAQQLVRDLFVVDEIGAQPLDRYRLAMELTRRVPHIVEDTPHPDDRGRGRQQQQHQHDRERPRPLATQTPPAFCPLGPSIASALILSASGRLRQLSPSYRRQAPPRLKDDLSRAPATRKPARNRADA